jgi:hypothetical protein
MIEESLLRIKFINLFLNKYHNCGTERIDFRILESIAPQLS